MVPEVTSLPRQKLVRITMPYLIGLTLALAATKVAAPSWLSSLPALALSAVTLAAAVLSWAADGMMDSTFSSPAGRIYLALAALSGPVAFGIGAFVRSMREVFAFLAAYLAAALLLSKTGQALGRLLCRLSRQFVVTVCVLFIFMVVGIMWRLNWRPDDSRTSLFFLLGITFGGVNSGHGEAVAAATKLQSPQD